MAYVKTTVTEGNILNDLAALFGEQGWEISNYFKKTVFPASYFNPTNPPPGISRLLFSVAEHIIFKHPHKELYYGIALYGEFSEVHYALPEKIRPMNAVETTIDPDIPDIKIVRSADNFKDLADWMTNKFPHFKQGHTLYFYMLDSVTGDLPKPGDSRNDIVLPTESNKQSDLKKSALDVEVHDAGYKIIEGKEFYKIFEAYPSYNQSPFVEASIRIPSRENFVSNASVENPHIQSNWHADSLIDIEGSITDKYIFVTLTADAAASFEGNGVPKIPLFMGEFIPENLKDKDNYALASGTAFKKDDPEFDYDDPTVTIKPLLQPILKNWVYHQSNGIDNIMVYRGGKGSYYQAHYLSADVPSNLMPPARMHNKRGYPRAWKQPESDVWRYRHNPSNYSGRVPSSVMYIVSPEEGPRGKLPDSIAVLPLNIVDGDKFKERVMNCEDEFVYYTYQLVEGISAWTKIPGVAYRQMGVGILSEDLDIDTPFPIYHSPIERLILRMWDSNQEDGDIVTVRINGIVVAEEAELFNEPIEIPIDLKTGVNILQFEGISAGTSGGLTASMTLGDVEGNLLTDKEVVLDMPRDNTNASGEYQGERPVREWVIKR